MFQFVSDRKAQGATFGPGGSVCRADQTRYRSIWGVVEGDMVGPWTGDMIANGEIRSADGKASLGGSPVTYKDKPHIVTEGRTKWQEFQIPIEDVERWNRYEAQQGNDQIRAFQAKEEAKRQEFGRKPELQIDSLDIPMTPPEFSAPAAPSPSSSAAKAPSPKQIAAAAKAREAAAAKRAAKALSTPVSVPT